MMNRRQILCATAAAALVARVPAAHAATYDLVIKGGRVIDPSLGLDGVRDVAIAGGRIVAVEAGIFEEAAEMIDARSKIVTAGLIDIHAHAGRGKDAPAMIVQDGVTGFVDAGSAGYDNIEEIAAVVRAAPQMGRLLINIAERTGFPARPCAS
jgi:dihydroorotase